MNASTTGNIYGIYDMSGGNNEYAMAWRIWEENPLYVASEFNGGTTMPEQKY